MYRLSWIKWIYVLLIGALLLTACAPAAAPTPQVIEKL